VFVLLFVMHFHYAHKLRTEHKSGMRFYFGGASVYLLVLIVMDSHFSHKEGAESSGLGLADL